MDMQPSRDLRHSIDSLEVRRPPLPSKPRTVWTWDMFPHRTPMNIIEELRSIVILDGNVTKFQRKLDELTSSSEEEFDIRDLANAVMSVAVSRDCTPFVSELLRRGMPMDKSYVFDINAPTTEVDPPVLGDAAIHDEKITLWLLERGADANRQCSIDITPLSLAVQYGTIHTIQVMVDDYDGDIHKGQLLHHAVRRKIDVIPVLELLLDRGAIVNQTMFENHDWSRRFHFWMPLGTALHEAARLDNVKASRYLLRRGIDARIRDTKGDTALEWAKKCNSATVVALLEEVENNVTKESSVCDGLRGCDGEDQQATPRSNYCSTM